LRGALAEKSRQLGLGNHCRFDGDSRDVAEALREIDIFVLPSLSEALSNSLLEAMACGCAVAASRTGGNPELVTHEETGLLFRPADAEDLTSVLLRLLADQDLRRRLAEAAPVFVASRFGIRDSVAVMASIYDRYLASPR
jgi:glycosyltransferase involved in cell wall biosynthesis